MAAEASQILVDSVPINAPIYWSGNTVLFDGYVLLIMALPEISGAAWTRVSLKNTTPQLRIPTRVKINITNGVFDTQTKIWQTTSINPPNVKYAAFYYDSTNRLIAVDTTLFSVIASPHLLQIPTLLSPTAATTATLPEDVPSTQITTLTYNTPTREDVTGAKNGVNTTFSISHEGTVIFLIINGTVLDDNSANYTRSGTTITMVSPIPASNDTFEAVIYG